MANVKMVNPEILAMAAAITFGNDGKSYFGVGEVAKITGLDKKLIPAEFEAAGILATPSGEQGKGRKYSALDIATYMYKDRVAPLRGRLGA